MLSKKNKEFLKETYILLMLCGMFIFCWLETSMTLAFLTMAVWGIALEISKFNKVDKW